MCTADIDDEVVIIVVGDLCRILRGSVHHLPVLVMTCRVLCYLQAASTPPPRLALSAQTDTLEYNQIAEVDYHAR